MYVEVLITSSRPYGPANLRPEARLARPRGMLARVYLVADLLAAEQTQTPAPRLGHFDFSIWTLATRYDRLISVWSRLLANHYPNDGTKTFQCADQSVDYLSLDYPDC